MIAGFEKKSVSLRLSVTERCQLNCLYCRPAAGQADMSCARPADSLNLDDIARFVNLIQTHFHLTKVHLTGGEPLLEQQLEKLVSQLAAHGLDLALTTNAQTLADRAESLQRAGLRRVNISLDSLDPQTFAKMTRGGDVTRTRAGIERAVAVGLSPVKINMTVLRGHNDHEIEAVVRYGLDLGCEVRFLELMPIGPALDRFKDLFVSAAEIRRHLQDCFTLDPIDGAAGQSAKRFQARDSEDREGRLGLIAPYTHPFCQGCRRLRLTRTGQLITCLASGQAINLRQWLSVSDARACDRIVTTVHRALDAKCMRGSFHTPRTMVAVGG